jgi:succinyl-CoA synthetase alpha subunit
MAILIDKNTKYLIQGVTGKEGTRTLNWMMGLDAQVLAGVTPGKGGQEINGAKNRLGKELPAIPVYDSVAEAMTNHPEINATCVYVPPKFVFSAVKEALLTKIPLIHIFAEGVPVKDTATLLELAKKSGSRIVGPSSIGIISPGKSVMGSMSGGNDELLLAPFDEKVKVNKSGGGVLVMSKSGGMAQTIANMLTSEGIAQSTVIGLGGDRLIGTTYEDLIDLCIQDDETWGIVLIGEIGGSYEEDFALALKKKNFKKPVVAFVSGIFAEKLPQGVSFGHAGAIVSKTVGTRDGKIKALKNSGVLIAQSPEDIVELLKTQL